MFKFKIGATIPVVQYGNLQPELEVEAETFEEAQALVLPHIERLWQQYGEKPLNTSKGKLLKAFVGGEIYYDSVAHVYKNEAGETYLSGSVFADGTKKPFDTKMISQKMAKASGVEAQDIVDMWKLKSEVSNGLGTAIHGALELYGRYLEVCKKMKKDYHLHNHPILQPIVESFYKGREDEKAIYEALVVDHATKRAGQIDRILVIGRKKCRIQDFKSNIDITDSLDKYWQQLSFYAAILTAGGWDVEGLDIFHLLNSEWKTYSNKVLNIDG